jgi:hypothetical protein
VEMLTRNIRHKIFEGTAETATRLFLLAVLPMDPKVADCQCYPSENSPGLLHSSIVEIISMLLD